MKPKKRPRIFGAVFFGCELLTDVLGVNVDAGLRVVNQIPSRMIRIVIDNYVVRASPAPVGSKFPIRRENFKTEAAVEPETVVITVNSGKAVVMVRTKVIEAAVSVRLINVESRVVPVVVTVPLVVTDVGPLIDSSVLVVVILRLAALSAGRRRGRNMAAVSPVDWSSALLLLGRTLLLTRALMLITALRKCARSCDKSQSKNEPKYLLHNSLQFEKRFRLSNEEPEYPIR